MGDKDALENEQKVRERQEQYIRYSELRDKVGLKDADVSRIASVGKSTFSDWRNGRSAPGIKKLNSIARALNMDVDTFLGKVLEDRDGSSEMYYLNDETARIAQRVFENPDLRILFDAADDSRPEDIQMAADMLKRFKETNPDG